MGKGMLWPQVYKMYCTQWNPHWSLLAEAQPSTPQTSFQIKTRVRTKIGGCGKSTELAFWKMVYGIIGGSNLYALHIFWEKNGVGLFYPDLIMIGQSYNSHCWTESEHNQTSGCSRKGKKAKTARNWVDIISEPHHWSTCTITFGITDNSDISKNPNWTDGCSLE